jgi:hypothetical protein
MRTRFNSPISEGNAFKFINVFFFADGHAFYQGGVSAQFSLCKGIFKNVNSFPVPWQTTLGIAELRLLIVVPWFSI